MISWLLLSPVLALWSRPALARAPIVPDALEVLRQGAEPPNEPYAAEFVVVGQAGPEGKPVSRRVSVRFSPPNLYRREIRDPAGEVAQIVVEDGRSEWIYDPARRRVWRGEPADPLFKRFGPDEEIDRLSDNYDVAIATGARAVGRPTWRLELRGRADGALSRRLWVDRKSSLVLRSESFLPDGTPSESVVCTRLRRGAASDPAWFRFSPPAGAAVVRRTEPDYLALDEAKASGTEPRLPAWLPSGYVFESLDVMPKGRRKVVHSRFSDGINVISLFQCPPRVRLDLGGRQRQRVRLASGRGTLTRAAEGNVLIWNSGGWHFVLVGPISAQNLQRLAESVR